MVFYLFRHRIRIFTLGLWRARGSALRDQRAKSATVQDRRTEKGGRTTEEMSILMEMIRNEMWLFFSTVLIRSEETIVQ